MRGAAAEFRFDDLPHHRREPVTLRTDLAKDALVLGRRHESEAVGQGRGADPREGARDRLVDSDNFATSRDRSSQFRFFSQFCARSGVLREEPTNVRGVALKLAVRGGSLLECPKPPHPVVRLPEDAQAEQADRDDQHGSAHERNEQLGVDLGRQAPDRADERIVARA